MSFCPECGRQLSDGEVCNCQAQNTQQVQPDAYIMCSGYIASSLK